MSGILYGASCHAVETMKSLHETFMLFRYLKSINTEIQLHAIIRGTSVNIAAMHCYYLVLIYGISYDCDNVCV